MFECILTEITPELAKDIVIYTKSKYDHGVTIIKGLKGGIYEIEYNESFIYFDKNSFNVFIDSTKKNKPKSSDESSTVEHQ